MKSKYKFLIILTITFLASCGADEDDEAPRKTRRVSGAPSRKPRTRKTPRLRWRTKHWCATPRRS